MRLVLVILATVLCLATFAADDSKAEQFARERRIRTEARKLAAAAHRALDRGEYESAIEQHKRSAALLRDADEIVEKLITDAVADLAGDDFDRREAATRQLSKLSSGAIPKLEEIAKRSEPEVALRLQQAVEALRQADEDSDGRLHQWAMDASASSEYQPGDWSAKQATGKPNTFNAGDSVTAWASLDADGGPEWLQLSYAQPVLPTLVRVAETFNPGAVTKIEALDAAGNWHELWQGKDTTAVAPGWLEVRIDPAKAVLTKVIKLTIDSAAVPGWNEIDAVELIGDLEADAPSKPAPKATTAKK